MPIRRFNYTGRKRLRRSDMRITLHEHHGAPHRFDADLSVTGYDLPRKAFVFVEAQRQTSWMRFRFGTVANATPQDDLVLTEFDSSEGVLFRVRVTSTDDPKALLLAVANRIRARRPDEVEQNRVPLLPVKADESLGDQVSRVDFSDYPLLLINADVGHWQTVARNPVFASLVYPAALREILTRILYVEEHFDTNDNEDWRSNRLRFAALLPSVPEPPSGSDDESVDDWIDEAVASFCRRFAMMSRFQQYWSEEGER